MTGDPRAPVVLRAPAQPSVIPVARQVATGAALVAGLDDEGVHDVKVAVTEACSNAVRHAYPDTLPGQVTLAAWTASDAVVISVRDDGVGFHQDEERGDGVGLLTMAALASEISVRSTAHGTEVVMAFRLPPAAA